MSFVDIRRPRDHVALVTLNRPERMNAMAFDVMVPLREALEDLAHDHDIRVVVLTGAGEGFCSGADQKDPGRAPGVHGLPHPTAGLRAMRQLEDVVEALRELPQPVVAAVNGAAIGGGLCLALSCDIRLAARSAYVRAAGITNGLTASELGLSYLLPRAVGSSRAFEIMLTGRDVDGDEAARIGLVSECVDDEALLDRCYEIAERIAALSRLGIEMTKRTLWDGLDAASLRQHMHYEGVGQVYARLLTDNFEEAVQARQQGRRPRFRDTR